MALHETMDLWYAHQGTTVLLVTKLPEGSSRRVGYDDSGWTTYERCSAEQIKKFFMIGGKCTWKLVLDLGVSEGEAEGVGRAAASKLHARSCLTHLRVSCRRTRAAKLACRTGRF